LEFIKKIIDGFMTLKKFDEIVIQEEAFKKLAENLQSLLSQNNLNANQLGQILGIPMMTIRRLLSGETTDPRISTLKLIANYFNVTVDYLVSENKANLANPVNKSKSYLVPKLDWSTVGKISSFEEIDLSKWQEWQSISLQDKELISRHAFALESRPSMYPRFPYGTVFIIDSEIEPTDGDTVLIKLKSNKELTLRELIIDPPEWQLYPIVPGSSILPYSKENHEIIGINILTMLYNRKDHS
jgi:transcriptional regulator with XRE-family HTH domain